VLYIVNCLLVLSLLLCTYSLFFILHLVAFFGGIKCSDKRNFNIISDNISISDQLDTLIDVEIALEYSSLYNSSDQFVCDKLNRM
jgi:hypothetical protein